MKPRGKNDAGDLLDASAGRWVRCRWRNTHIASRDHPRKFASLSNIYLEVLLVKPSCKHDVSSMLDTSAAQSGSRPTENHALFQLRPLAEVRLHAINVTEVFLVKPSRNNDERGMLDAPVARSGSRPIAKPAYRQWRPQRCSGSFPK